MVADVKKKPDCPCGELIAGTRDIALETGSFQAVIGYLPLLTSTALLLEPAPAWVLHY